MIINFYKKGITAMEILVVIGVLGLIFAIVLPQFSKMRENQVLKSAVGDVLSSFNKARSETLASVDSSSFGVHLQSDKVIIFKGTVYVVNDVNNETTEIVAPASISNVTLGGVSGNSGDLYFNRLSGTPSATGTVTVSTSSRSKIITISAIGVVSSN